MKYAVFGPREGSVKGEIYSDAARVAACLDSVKDLDLIIVGGGKGVELLAEQWADARNIKKIVVRPRLVDRSVNVHGSIPAHIAFSRRNMEILHQSDAVIGFWDGRFKEMIDIFRTAILMNKNVLLFPM